jgi:anaerobic C4-dicarboxylate transporter
MNDLQASPVSTPPRYLAAAAILIAFAIALVCGTGVAAFAGLLPASNHVAAAVTVAPLIDLQVGSDADAHHL